MCGQIIKQMLLAFFLHNFDESHSRTFFYDCFDIDIVVFFANILFQKKCSKKYVPAQIAVSLWECYYKTPVEHIKEGLHTKKPFHVPFYLLFGYEYPNPDEDDES